MDSTDDIWESFGEAIAKDKPLKTTTVVCTNCEQPVEQGNIHNGYKVCENCGIVLENVIDTSAEWRCFTTISHGCDQTMVRCAETVNPLMPNTIQMNTFIGDGDKKLQRVHQWNNMSVRERMFHHINKEFQDIVRTNDLPQAVQRTMCEYYYAVYTAMDERNYGIKRCNIRSGLKAACLYYACKLHKIPRESKEIAKILNITRKVVTRGCNLFAEVMGDEFKKMPPFKPMDFVERFCAALGVTFKETKLVISAVEWLEKYKLLHESTPPTVAAAVLYRVLNQVNKQVTTDYVYSKCHVSKTVLQKLVSKLDSYKEFTVVVDKLLVNNK